MSPTASRASALRLSFLLLWRDLLARELNLLLVALLVAVAAVTTVGFFVDRLDRALNEQALHLLGGDLVLRADRPIPEDWTRKARALGLRVAHTASFPSMAMAESSTPAADEEDEGEALPPTQLASVLAVSHDYPLRGELTVTADEAGPSASVSGTDDGASPGRAVDAQQAPARGPSSASAPTAPGDLQARTSETIQHGPPAGAVFVDESLAQALGLKLGDTLALGNALRHGLMAPMPAQTAVSASPQVDDARGTSHAAVAGLDAGALRHAGQGAAPSAALLRPISALSRSQGSDAPGNTSASVRSMSPRPLLATMPALEITPLREIPLGLVGDVAGLAQARDFMLVLGADGRLWARGLNTRGQLGVGIAQAQVNDFLPLPGHDYQAVAVGGAHALALDRQGNLWGWGDDLYGQLGRGRANHTPQDRPTRIARDIVAMAAGDRHSLAIRKDGALLAWGENRWGEVGNGSQESVTEPVVVGEGFRAVAAGAGYSLAIDRQGRLWAWGRGESGRLGTGNEDDQSRPVLIGSGYRSVTASTAQSFAIGQDGTLWAWGSNLLGQLGDGTHEDRLSPVKIGSGYVAVAAGGAHAVGLQRDGSVWAWGSNGVGQLADGSLDDRLRPARIGRGYDFIGAAGAASTLARRDGVLRTAGARLLQ